MLRDRSDKVTGAYRHWDRSGKTIINSKPKIPLSRFQNDHNENLEPHNLGTRKSRTMHIHHKEHMRPYQTYIKSRTFANSSRSQQSTPRHQSTNLRAHRPPTKRVVTPPEPLQYHTQPIPISPKYGETIPTNSAHPTSIPSSS